MTDQPHEFLGAPWEAIAQADMLRWVEAELEGLGNGPLSSQSRQTLAAWRESLCLGLWPADAGPVIEEGIRLCERLVMHASPALRERVICRTVMVRLWLVGISRAVERAS